VTAPGLRALRAAWRLVPAVRVRSLARTLARVAVLAVTLAAIAPVVAGGAPASGGERPWVLDAGRVTVIAPDAASLERIREVARRADAALAVAAAFFATPAPHVTVVIRRDDDVYNAWVDPLGGPVVTVPLQPPWPGEVGSGAPDPFRLLLVHEMIHAVHFGGRPGSLPVPTGVVGADLPWPPPMWLLEGVAVWAESRAVPGGGGRLDDPDARAVIRALADSDGWPTLADAARLPSEAWPGGRTRYLLGGAFVAQLVDRAGLPGFRDALRRFETAPPWTGFDDAWREVVGGELEVAWAALRAQLRAEARALEDAVGETVLDRWAGPSSQVRQPARSPARSPDGARLAWVEGRTVRVATVGTDGGASEAVAVQLRSTPRGPAWRDVDALVYVRLRDGPHGRYGELHELRLATGAERRLTHGARAHAAAPLSDGCIAFVRDDGLGPSSVRRWCAGGPDAGTDVWSAPAGARIVGLAASPAGRVAAVLDRSGQRALVAWPRLDASVAGASRRWPEPDPVPVALGNALRGPVWEGESAIWLVAAADRDRTGAWRIDVATGRAELLAAPRHGVVDLTPGVIAARRAGGPVLTRVLEAPLRSVAGRVDAGRVDASAFEPAVSGLDGFELDAVEPRDPSTTPLDAAPPRPYDPRRGLRVLGWLPDDLGVGGVGARLVAAEPTRRYAIEAVAGRVPTGDGAWGRPAFGISLQAGRASLVPTPAPRDPVAVTLRLGLLPFAPHRAPLERPRPHLELGVDATTAGEPAVRMGARLVARVADDGAVRSGGSLRIAASDGVADAWGVPRKGWAVAGTLRNDPVRNDPVRGDRSSGAWLDAAAWTHAGLPGDPTAEATIRAGWRPPAPVPATAFEDVAASTALSLGWTVPVGAYLADGRWALERVRLAPRLRLGAGETSALGVEALVAADLVLGYGATASLALEVGVAWSGADGRPGAWLRWSVPGLR